MAPETYCSEASLAVGEPLAGSAAEATHWLVIEHAGAWGPKGVEDSGLPEELVTYLRKLGKLQPGLRTQLIRRGEGRTSREAAPRLFLAQSRERGSVLWSLPLPESAGFPELGLEAWLREGLVPSAATQVYEPLYLVCVHGKRDRCCALKGLPVYNALRELSPEQVFQTTHLGGHRFAATLVVLPEGLCYGRVLASEATALSQAHARGELHELARMRGRTSYSSVVQAAEVTLREQLAELRIDALRFVQHTAEAGHERVTFLHEATGQEHVVELQRKLFAPAPASCGAEPVPAKGLVQLDRPRP